MDIDENVHTIMNFEVSYYGCLFLLSFIVSIYIFYSSFKDVYKTQLYITLTSIVGVASGKIFYYVFYSNSIFNLSITSGLSSHGVLIGLYLSAYFISKIYKESYNKLLNVFLVSSVVSGSFIRLGNFFSSEKYGDISTGHFDILRKMALVDSTQNYTRHPVQLYECILFLLLGVFLLKYGVHRKVNLSYIGICVSIFGIRILINYFFCKTCNSSEQIFNLVYFMFFFLIYITSKYTRCCS